MGKSKLSIEHQFICQQVLKICNIDTKDLSSLGIPRNCILGYFYTYIEVHVLSTAGTLTHADRSFYTEDHIVTGVHYLILWCQETCSEIGDSES